jgi:hypothetical protein
MTTVMMTAPATYIRAVLRGFADPRKTAMTSSAVGETAASSANPVA